MGLSARLGREYRKNISEKLELRLGADLSFTYNRSKYDYNDKSINNNDILRKQTTYGPGINLVLGLNYVLNDKFIFGAEILPAYNYVTGTAIDKDKYINNGKSVKSDFSGFSYGLSNTSALLTLAYRL